MYILKQEFILSDNIKGIAFNLPVIVSLLEYNNLNKQQKNCYQKILTHI